MGELAATHGSGKLHRREVRQCGGGAEAQHAAREASGGAWRGKSGGGAWRASLKGGGGTAYSAGSSVLVAQSMRTQDERWDFCLSRWMRFGRWIDGRKYAVTCQR
jgi:hypothetical protein